MTTVIVPKFSEISNQNTLIEGLGGPKDVFFYLENFPESIYNKSPDSHLYKFMRSLLGDAGVNGIKKNFLDARLLLEEMGIDSFDLDKFYGSPFSFGRILDEDLGSDPSDLIPIDQWELIKAQNSRYRNRALDYVNGAKAGNTPLGMRLVAKSGLGHDVEIIENYKYLFDVHSDDPLGLPYYGKTLSTEEMIVLPRREVGVDEQQIISIIGDTYPTSGSFYLIYNGIPTSDYIYTYNAINASTIPFDATNDQVRLALESIPEIGEGNIKVTGGPGPTLPWTITFQGILSQRDVPQLIVMSNLLDGTTAIPMVVNTIQGGQESVDEVAFIPPADAHNLMDAIDRIRSQTTIMTLGEAKGLSERTNWNQVSSSSEYVEVVRFVTGNPNVDWPTGKSEFWIQANTEQQAPRAYGDLQYHYTGFHNISGVDVSTVINPTLKSDVVLADYAEPLFVTSAAENASLINGIYPTSYQDLSGIPPIRYKEEQFWSSQDWNIQGFQIDQVQDEWIILRLPFVQCVNYLSFDIFRDDIQLNIEYDANDDTLSESWIPVTPVEPYSDILVRSSGQDTWASVGFTFTDRLGGLIWTRMLKINLQRISSPDHWGFPIKVKNARMGRNVA